MVGKYPVMKKILLLRESQSLLSNQLGVQLEAEGFCVDHPRGEDAAWLEDIKTVQPDVILLEIMEASYVTRYQICHQLRQDGQTENIPVLLLGGEHGNGSGNAALHYLLEGLHVGANDYLQAPYEIAELVGKINAALRLKASLEKAQVLAEQLNSVNEELYQRNIQVEKELHIARQLQQSLLPAALPVEDENSELGPMFTKIHYQDEKIRISGIYLPCDALGGDLYDVLKFSDNSMGISITDVSGHGVPAGFITAIFKTSLYRVTHENSDPAQVLFHLNNELFDIVKTGDYVTSVYLRIDMETMALECSGAGHPYPFYYQAAEKDVQRLQKNGTPLVWVRDIEYPKDSIRLGPGDKVFLFTDGVSELRNPAGEMYGEDRIKTVMLEAIAQEAPYFTDVLIGDLSDFTEGAPLEDDISMVLIEAL
jgi:phosphoserine phosphatase RsbU/P